MPDTLTAENPRAVIGGNNPPLAEILATETQALEARADELIGGASRAAVEDEDSSGKAVTLVKMLTAHIADVEAWKDERKKPVLEQDRAIMARFNDLANPLKKAKADVTKLLDGYRQKLAAEAAAERRRAEAEARAAAAEAARLAEEAATVQDVIAANDALAAAEDLAAKAAQVAAAPIRSSTGGVASVRKTWTHEITDRRAALLHALKVDPDAIHAAVAEIVARQVKAGVRAFDGARIYQTETTQVR